MSGALLRSQERGKDGTACPASAHSALGQYSSSASLRDNGSASPGSPHVPRVDSNEPGCAEKSVSCHFVLITH